MELLKQPLCHPLSLHQQVITLCAATHKIFADVPLNKVKAFQMELLNYIDDTYPQIGETIESTKTLDDETIEKIVQAAEAYKNR